MAVGGTGPPPDPPEQELLPAPRSALPEETRLEEDLEKRKIYYAPDVKIFGEASTIWEKWER